MAPCGTREGHVATCHPGHSAARRTASREAGAEPPLRALDGLVNAPGGAVSCGPRPFPGALAFGFTRSMQEEPGVPVVHIFPTA
jgi:hypothetical protein